MRAAVASSERKAAEQAAERAAADAAKRQAEGRSAKEAAGASSRSVIGESADVFVRRWNLMLCRPNCPLSEDVAVTFSGLSYSEVRLGKDTTLYRAFHKPADKFGPYWSRSEAKGTQAVIDRAIPASSNGNVADRTVAIRVPRGETVYEGLAGTPSAGPVGGGSQVVVLRIDPKWEVRQ